MKQSWCQSGLQMLMIDPEMTCKPRHLKSKSWSWEGSNACLKINIRINIMTCLWPGGANGVLQHYSTGRMVLCLSCWRAAGVEPKSWCVTWVCGNWFLSKKCLKCEKLLRMIEFESFIVFMISKFGWIASWCFRFFCWKNGEATVASSQMWMRWLHLAVTWITSPKTNMTMEKQPFQKCISY